MSGDGFDTWVLEVRGAGLSTNGVDLSGVKKPLNAKSKHESALADSDISSVEEKRTYMVSKLDQFQLSTKPMKASMRLSGRLSGFHKEGWSQQLSVGYVI